MKINTVYSCLIRLVTPTQTLVRVDVPAITVKHLADAALLAKRCVFTVEILVGQHA